MCTILATVAFWRKSIRAYLLLSTFYSTKISYLEKQHGRRGKVEETKGSVQRTNYRVEKEIQKAMATPELDAVKLVGLRNSYIDKKENIKQLDDKILDIIPEDE